MFPRILMLIILSTIVLAGCKVKENKSISEEIMDKYNYEQAWTKVEELERKGLAKTMFKKVIEIYDHADQSGDTEQLIKSLVYQGKYYITVEEDGLIKTIERFESDLKKFGQPEKSILQSMLAELYDTYLTQYLWKIGNRIPTTEKTDEDIRNWSPKQFVDKSTSLYLASVKYDSLDKLSTANFTELVTQKKDASSYRNTLLDILGHRAIRYFSVGKSFLSESPDRYILNDPGLFESTEVFSNMDFSGKAESRELTVLKLFQKLLHSKQKQDDKDAILDLEINRLQYVRRHFIGNESDKIYERALKKFIIDNAGLEGEAEVNYYLAELYYKMGNQETNLGTNEASYFLQAHELCMKTIEDHPGSIGADMCRSLLSRIENKHLNVRTEMVNLPGEHLISRIEYKNLTTVFLKVVLLDRSKYEKLNKVRHDDIAGLIKSLKTVQSKRLTLPGASDFEQHSVEYAIEPLKLGSYALVVSDNEQFDPKKGVLQVAPFFVSEMSYWHTNVEDKQMIYVVDRKTGQALEGITVKIFQWNYETRTPYKKLLKTIVTDNNGQASFDNIGSRGYNYSIELESSKESLFFENSIYARNDGYHSSRREREKILYFTDRSIYRPGQTVYFKGLLIRDNFETGPEIIPFRKNIEVVLKDVNQQKISSVDLSTNEFGSFSGSFTLPEKGLTGQFNIGSDQTNDVNYFRVESYKRPKFFVELSPYESSYKLGDKISVDGSAQTYGGVNISNAKVTYRVMRKSYFPFWSYSWRPIPFNTQKLEIANGVTETDDQGNFKIPVELLADDQVPGKYRPHFHYEVLAEVVDPTGETHVDKLSIRAGWTELDVSLSVPKESHQDSMLKLEVISNNWNGKPQGLKGKLKVFELKSPDKVFRKRYWVVPDQWLYNKEAFGQLLPSYGFKGEEDPHEWEVLNQVKEIDFNTDQNKEYMLDLSAGSYKIVLEYLSGLGLREQIEVFTAVFNDRRLPSQVPYKFEAEGGEPGQTAKIRLQSAKVRTAVFFELFEKNERVTAEWKTLNPMENIVVEIEEKHRGNFFARISYVNNNRFYTENKTINVPWTNKELDFEYLSFRDKLEPGADESWTIRITGKKKDLVLAEFLATMYDASLDDISSHSWGASIFRTNYLSSRIHYFGFGQNRSRSYVDRDWNKYYYSGKSRTYNTINWFGLENIPGYQVFREGVGVVESAPPYTRERMKTDRVASGVAEPLVEMDAVTIRENEEEAFDGETANGNTEIQENETVHSPAQQPVRTNLNETVFFYPELKTDESGNVLIQFKMNEALTSWKFLGFAHSKDLKTGITTNTVKTQKELMIRPNAPRFVRLGDKIEFSASVSNLSEEKLAGDARIEFYDAVTLKKMSSTFLEAEAEKAFEVLPGGNIGLSWKIQFPDDSPDLLQYKVFAESGSFIDGEAGYLPVLSNRVLVTETLPMWIGGDQRKSFEFKAMDKISDPSLKTHRFSLESTSNPAWYVIQAMPYISEYQERNSIQLVNALYANMLAEQIVNKNPIIKRVFKKWKEEAKKNPGSLLSNLQRNEELKNILLSETPWLLEGMDEAEQKKNIALLFDVNNVQQEKIQIIRLLKSLQRFDGGFSWYSGGRSSEYLTLYVVLTLGRLEALGIEVLSDTRLSNMVKQSISFIDEKFAERYDKLLKNVKEGRIDLDQDHLGSIDVLYLYTRSIFNEVKISPKAKEARIFYMNQAEKYYLGKNNYLQGMIALALHNGGNSTKAKEILISLEERSIYNEELGRYWKDRNGYHWTAFPIERQALLIEAFNSILKDDDIVNEMQIWLLKHKQTNRWKTPRASIAAINALLLNNQEILTEDKMLTIKIDGAILKPSEVHEYHEAGTGYFKKSWSGEEVKQGMKDIEMENPNDHIAWGAAYWQYFQDIQKVTTFEDTPLTIQKELFRVINDKKGEKLVLIEHGESVQPGTKIIVKLRIEVDRSMDFIRLDDQRAAAMEPLNQLSGYKWTGGLFYYEAPGDTGTSFFIDHLPRGVFTIEYPLRTVHSGGYTVGLATIQSMYAPEFSSHSEGSRINVE